MKALRCEMLLLILVFLLRFVTISLTITACVNFRLNGFAVSNGKVYLGLSNRVEILENDYCTKRIPISKFISSGYIFCLEDDHIVIYSSLGKKTYDMGGNLLDTQEYSDTRVFNEKEKQKNTYTDADGVTYMQKSTLGYYSIVNQHTKEVVYRMPALDYCIKILQKVLDIAMIILIVYGIIKEWQLQIGQRSVFDYIKAKLSGRE